MAPVLGADVGPFDLPPFQLDELPAVWTRKVEPPLVASEKPLPDPALDHGGRRGHEGLGA